MDRNATAGPKRPSRRRPAEILTADEVLALIRACSPTAPTGVRNRALIAVLWRSGLRVGEALALELRDVDLVAATLRVRHGKGDKSRTVGLDEQTAALIARWLDHRRALRPGARAPALCTVAGATIKTGHAGERHPRRARSTIGRWETGAREGSSSYASRRESRSTASSRRARTA